MKNARQLVNIAALSAGSLLVVGLAVAVLLLALEILSPSDFWSPAAAFRTGLYATLVLGAGPALLLGAPGYWMLWRAGREHWRTALPAGGVFGALVGLIEPALLVWGVACGTIAAALTHLAARRWLGPNNSIKTFPSTPPIEQG